MRTVQDVLDACLALARPLPPLDVVLHDAVGCVLADDVVARDDLPLTDVAECDGYAIRAEEVALLAAAAGDDSTLHLRVLDDVLSGAGDPGRLVPGSTIRLASGAPVPGNASAVVPLSGTDGGVALVSIRSPVRDGAHVRRAGEQVRRGEVLLAAGGRVGPRQIAVLAAAGFGRVGVHPRPRVVVVPVGSDLTEPGRSRRDGQVYDANGHALASAVLDERATVFRVPAVPDDHGRLRECIDDQVVRADLVILTGGLSAGREDTVRDVLGRVGRVEVDDVAISPGRRVGVGLVGDGVPLIALPGSPVAVQTAFEVFVRPMLRSMAGEAQLDRRSVPATATRAWDSPSELRQLVPGVLTGAVSDYSFSPIGDPGAPSLSALARATALAVVPEQVTHVGPGDALACLVLDGTVLDGTVLDGTVLDGTVLDGMVLDGAVLHGADGAVLDE